MEIVIYKNDTKDSFTGIYASMENGKLTITEQDIGEFEKEYSRDGEVESFVFFDVPNTRRLMSTLGAISDSEFLASLKHRFKKYRGVIRMELCKFCNEHGIQFHSLINEQQKGMRL